MIRNQDLTTLFVIIILLIFYFLQIFQRVKLVYLFRSVSYHFRNILVPYNVDDLGISAQALQLLIILTISIYSFFAYQSVVMTYFGPKFSGSLNFG